MKDSSYLSKLIYSVSSVLFLMLLWQLLSFSMGNDQQILFPGLGKIFIEIGNIFKTGDILKVFVTLGRTLLLICISFIVCLLLGLLYVVFPQSYYFLKPIVNILKAAPFIIISVYIYYIFFGTKTDASVYILGFFVVFPLMYEGFIQAIDNINCDIKDDLSLLQISTFKKFLKVYIPLIVPSIVLTLLQGFGLGIKIVVMGEYIFDIDKSTGQAIKYSNIVEQAPLLAWLIIIVIAVCLIDLIILLINKKRLANNNK